jgi:Zn-dependent protease
MFTQLGIHDLITVLVTILVSMTIHEAMHAYVAHALGDTTAKDEGRLTLNPLAHIDIVMTVILPVALIALGIPPIFVAKPVPFDPHRVRHGEYGAAIVAAAGPLSNLALAVLASLLIRFFDVGSLTQALAIFVQINLSFFVFNLIPLPPLDGSRVLYAFAPEPVQRIMYQIESMGFVVTILLLLLLSPFVGPLVSNLTHAIFTFLLR